jgi:3D (Asp-Asp-Asp) domain-containing protein
MKLFYGGSAVLVTAFLAITFFYLAGPSLGQSGQPRDQQQPAGASRRPETAPSPSGERPRRVSKAGNPSSSNEPGDPPDMLPANSGNSTPANGSAAINTPGLGPAEAYTATAYSLRGRGASGLGVHKGTIAADPRVLPYGTRVRLDAGPYSGEYLVTDAGTAVKGRKIDVWVASYGEACRFGRRTVKLTVLSYGGRRATRSQASQTSNH